MTNVTIISLIYRSARFADWVYDSALRYTPQIGRGEARFLFVANDASPALLAHLSAKGYPHIAHSNAEYTDEELFDLGYGTPGYMSRVYRGYNAGIRHAETDYVVLVNSDNFFSPDWLENLLKYSDRTRVITSLLVEREHPVHSVFPDAIHKEFGDSPDTFDEAGFIAYADRVKRTGLVRGGAYMPTLMHRDIAIEAGLYPCGNLAGATFDEVRRFGDEAFYDTLAGMGIGHFTALDSVVYHLKEGEKDDLEPIADADPTAAAEPLPPSPVTRYTGTPAVPRIGDSLDPTKRHTQLMDQLVGEHVERTGAAVAPPEGTPEALLEDAAQKMRARVQRVVGPRLVGPAMKVVHSVSWIVRPLRERSAARRAANRP